MEVVLRKSLMPRHLTEVDTRHGLRKSLMPRRLLEVDNRYGLRKSLMPRRLLEVDNRYGLRNAEPMSKARTDRLARIWELRCPTFR